MNSLTQCQRAGEKKKHKIKLLYFKEFSHAITKAGKSKTFRLRLSG